MLGDDVFLNSYHEEWTNVAKIFPTGLEMEKRHEEELMELKLQLKQALAEEQQVVYALMCQGQRPVLTRTVAGGRGGRPH